MEKCLVFWKMFRLELPNLSALARLCMTLTPSSASVERVFSILKSSFTVNQMTFALEDYTAASVMLQYNLRNCANEELLSL
jgi:hAT family C-terminal dimerisation region